MTADEAFLKEKAKLLIARERELLALKRKHKRLALWLALAQELPELVDPKLPLAEICARVSERMVAVLDLHTVAFYERQGAELRWIAGPGGTETDASPPTLGDGALALLEASPTGMCAESSSDDARALAAAVGLHRFLWHLIALTGRGVLFVAGYDRQRAQFFKPFDEDDLAHFTNTAHQLGLLLGNNDLVRQLERDKRLLQQFNAELERRVAERTLELADANRELLQAVATLRDKDARLEQDIEEARLFQQLILAAPPVAGAVEISTWYEPLERVGGDVFDICEPTPGAHRVFLADATGHGVQASMRTLLLKTEYDRLKLRHESPRLLIEDLNRRLVELFPNGDILCTGCCLDLVLDHAHGARVVYANAGGPPLVHWSSGGARSIYGETPMLAAGTNTWPEPLVFHMAAGDLLLVASDGLIEQRDPAGRFFEEVLLESGGVAGRSAAQYVQHLVSCFTAFRGDAPAGDDVTVVALRLPFESAPDKMTVNP